MGNSVRMQRKRGRKNNEEHDQVREKGADTHVQLANRDFIGRRVAASRERRTADGLFLFYFLRSLPEKKIRADRRTQNRDQGRPAESRGGQMRNEAVAQYG